VAQLFEFLILEGAQAGLSWITVLRKRDHYRQVFDHFNPEKIAAYQESDVERLLGDKGIIRNQLKIRSAINNAQQLLKLAETLDFSHWLWSFVDHQTVINKYETSSDVPATNDNAIAMSKALKQRGFTFVGPTICYAFMQATGMVNDHLTNCFRYQECVVLSKGCV